MASSPNLRSSEPAVVEQQSSLPAPAFPAQPPYLRAHPNYGVIVCTEHRTAFTKKNIDEHLTRAHLVKGSHKKQIYAWINAQHITDEVQQPLHLGPPIPGLRVLDGWQCTVGGCQLLTTSRDLMQRHLSKEHQLTSKAKRGAIGGGMASVSLQKWFATKGDFFVVDPQLGATSSNSSKLPAISTHSRASTTLDSSDLRVVHFQELFRRAQEPDSHASIISAPVHSAEITPFLKITKFHEHLAGLDSSQIVGSYQVPTALDDHPLLFLITESVIRVFQHASQLLAILHHVDARRLNSFIPGTLHQSPLAPLQESHTLKYYSHHWARLLCYFHRVVDEDHFTQPMFQPTTGQINAYHTLCEAVQQLLDFNPVDVDDEEDACRTTNAHLHEQRETLIRFIDRATLQFSMALVEHHTPEAGFASPIISFAAITAWDGKIHADGSTGGWAKIDRTSSHFSQLIYCSQLTLLQACHHRVSEGQFTSIREALQDLCPRWLQNDSYSPVAELNRFRLYALEVNANSVHAAQLRWHRDDETINYLGITYQVSFLAREIEYCLGHARRIFHRDLCFDLPDVPTFDLNQLSDNWDATAPNKSFIDDPRNAGLIAESTTWLCEQLPRRLELFDMVVHPSPEIGSHAGGPDQQIRSSFATVYEQSVQEFLEYMAILMHRGSGQPARMTEFCSLLWQNTTLATRNLFLHDGHVLFLLTYHKSIARTHASRYPVRFLLPEVGHLLVQFLVLIQPMRRMLHREVQCPAEISPYLWHNGLRIWKADEVSRISSSTSARSCGVVVNIRSWRQLAVGIAIKKFANCAYQGDWDLPGDPDDDLGGKSILDGLDGAMADVFHLQAAHSVRTGNMRYGGTVNFQNGLTDAGLQEYFRASRLWHHLCRPIASAPGKVAGHRRQTSTEIPRAQHPPLVKRVAQRQQPRRHQRHWGSETIQRTLQHLFPDQRPARFRSPHQAQLIEFIASGRAEILAVLSTGEGKSLSFLLPACFPHAATTVVVVPLVALKTDMTRRCQEAGLEYSVWHSHTDPLRYQHTPLIFVSVEQAVSQQFRSYLGQLDASEQLDRVVLDEAHLCLTTSTFRPKMRLLHELRNLHCQVVLLTATLPPLMQPQLEQAMLLSRPTVVRSQTCRSNIRLRIVPSQGRDLLRFTTERVNAALEHYRHDQTARLIVYTRSRKEADSLSQQLSCGVYYSDSGTLVEKEQVMRQWREGTYRVIVATSAFGVGVDYPGVRAVIHMDGPQDMISFAQEIGRSGRDGHGGTSYVILPSRWQPPTGAVSPGLPEVAMQRYLSSPRCLKAVLSRFLDGKEQMQYCTASDDHKPCTQCHSLGLFTPAELDSTPYWDTTRNPTVAPLTEDTSVEVPVSVDPASDLDGGYQRYQLRTRAAQEHRHQYRLQLTHHTGRCMICALLGSTSTRLPNTASRADEEHTLDKCPNPYRHEFTRAKKSAIERGQARGGWLAKYHACYRCGNPQEICSGPTVASSEPCAFPDLVFPTAWALYHMKNRWGQTLPQITGETTKRFVNEAAWMDWLGVACELADMRACQAARMADWVLSKMSS